MATNITPKERIKGGIAGLLVGDAFGIPKKIYEHLSETLIERI